MNKLVVIGLVVVLLFGIALFAFISTSSEEITEPEPTRPVEPLPVNPETPVQEEMVTYKGIVVEIQDGSVLTTGVEGIIGSVVVHLPEGFDTSLLPAVDSEITVQFNGAVAESYPMQIWAQEVILSEDDLVPIPDLPEEPKEVPLPPDYTELSSMAVRFTIDNAIQSVHVSEPFEVVLDVNPTTGYRTEITYPDALALESDVYIPKSKSSALVGAGSVRILQFTAETAGTFAIDCEVLAPGGDHVHTYSIEVEVLPER